MRTTLVLGGLFVLAAGCGGGAPAQTHTLKADVGGDVRDGFDNAPLAGVTVTLTDVDGRSQTATTNAAGLWTIENLLPGMYIETYEKPGYETWELPLAIEAYGSNDVSNVFIEHPMVMIEERPRAFVTVPFALTLEDGDSPNDGFSGVTAVYRPSVDGDIVVRSNRVLLFGDVYLVDNGGIAYGIRTDTATESVFTIPAAAIDAIDGGLGPDVDTDPYTWDSLVIEDFGSFSPIHAQSELLNAYVGVGVKP